ncbi:MAG TPA: hypothetical protein VE344_11280 [Methylomirabilota bacterium]|nr:hypothetical protein [Methylomirabilota bacterium]
MIKKFFLPFSLALMLTGCASTFTRLTPLQWPRNPNNLYPVEVQFNSPQQAMRWDSLKPYVLVGGQLYPLRAEPMVSNRWEGFVPVSPTSNETEFKFKFDYLYNAFGSEPKSASSTSSPYKLKIID